MNEATSQSFPTKMGRVKEIPGKELMALRKTLLDQLIRLRIRHLPTYLPTYLL